MWGLLSSPMTSMGLWWRNTMRSPIPVLARRPLRWWGVNFLINNIPTVVLGGIWLHYKNRRDFQSELNKMNIQDLE